MKRFSILTIYILLITAFSLQSVSAKKKLSAAKGTTYILLKNSSAIRLKDKDISIKRSSIPGASDTFFPSLKTQDGKLIPCQTEDLDFDGKWDELFFVVDLKAKATLKIWINWTAVKPAFPTRSAIRFGKRNSSNTPVISKNKDTFYPNMLPSRTGYEPYQTDGPTWENDKVGFRHYFDGRNSKDLFGKRVDWMSPKDVGLTANGAVEDNYHVLKDWGRDILPVANSMGLGGVGLLINNKLNRVGVIGTDTLHNIESTNFSILENGPIKSSFLLNYNNWKSDAGNVYQVSERPVIWPGMYAYQNNVTFSGLKGNEELVIGLSKVATNHPVKELKLKNWVVLYTHDHQSYNKEFIIGLAIIVPAASYNGYGEAPEKGSFSSSYYAKLKVNENGPSTYYAVGCWELEDPGFKSESYFEKYLRELVAQIDAQVSITVLAN